MNRDFSDPLLWAVIIGWILSVVLHEFAHGLVAYLGGDYTIRERGGLSLNPLHYLDPMMSIVLPALFVLMGGIPLPGGATYVRRDLLRNRLWKSAVSLAGPAMNFLLFLLLALPFHPVIGWIRPSSDLQQWTGSQVFLAVSAQLQIISIIINLLPIPPLDGFGVISPYLDEQTRQKLSTRQMSSTMMFVLFFVILFIPGVWQTIYLIKNKVMQGLGFDAFTQEFFRRSYNHILFGH